MSSKNRNDMDEAVALDPASQGRAWYRRKDYHRALIQFTKAVNDSTGFMALTALDNRAATYEKLGELEKGVKDAKTMIQLKPELSKGYLRAGKILQLQKKDEHALRIYERGLKYVKIGTDDSRVLLQGMFSQLQKKLVRLDQKFFDPLVKLPVELAEIVCSYLNMRDRVICLCVSKPWKRFLELSQDLWTEFDMSNVEKQISFKSLRAHCRRSNYTLTKAMIIVGHFDSSNLTFLIQKCKELESLEFRRGYLGESLTDIMPNAQKLRTLILGADVMIPILSVVKVLKARPELEIAEFGGIQHGNISITVDLPPLKAMKGLTLIASRSSTTGLAPPLNLTQLNECAPNLERVSIRGWRIHFRSSNFVDWPKLESVDLSHNDFGRAPSLDLSSFPPSLIHLNISHTSLSGPDDTPYDDTTKNAALPLLQSLNCENCTTMDIHDVTWLTSFSVEAGNLKSLKIGNLQEFGAPHNFARCDSLVELSLRGMDTKEPLLAEVLRKYPNLRRLDLSATRVTGVLVKEIMTKDSGPLEFLDLSSASKCASDAIAWARSLGTEVRVVIPGSGVAKTYRDRMGDQY